VARICKRVWQTSKGEWRTSWQVDFFDHQGTRQRKHFALRKQADAYRVAIEGRIRSGTYRPDSERITVLQACAAWLENCEGRNRRDERMTRRMLENYRDAVARRILHPEQGIGGYKLSALTASAVNGFRDRLRDAGVSVPTTRKILASVHTMLEYARSQDWVAVNAAHGVRVIGARDEGAQRITPPTKAAMRAILDAARVEDERRAGGKPDGRKPGPGEEAPLVLALTFAASTAVRAGEMWAVRWGDIDFDTSELRITRRVDRYRDEGAPKTAAGKRTVPLSGQLVTMLKEWRLRSTFSRPDDLIFANSEGRHTSHDNHAKRKFVPLFAQAGVARFSWHSLRHYAISTWIEAGLTPKTIQTFAGHASLQITMDRYGHLFPSDDHRTAMDAIAAGLLA
jgi:integrase